MPVFRSDGAAARLLAGAALVAAACLAQPAAAQLGPPVRLGPPPAPPPPSAIPAAPAGSLNGIPQAGSTSGGSLFGAAPSTGAVQDDSIKADALAPLDESWAGALATAERPLGTNLWDGTPRPLVATALPLLAPNTSPELQDLAVRLLLSDGAAPMGRDAQEGPSLVTLRLQRVIALGLVQKGAALLDGIRNPPHEEAFDRMRIEIRFLANDVDKGCDDAGELIGRYPSPWWDRALIACEALHREFDKAQLGLSLLREKKAPRDLVFDALVESIVGIRQGKLEKLPEPTPIVLSLLAAAKQPLPADALAAATPALLREWATNQAVPAGDRLAAAERAAALGSISVDELRDVYDRLDFKPEERAAALSKTDQAGPRARALLYEAARAQTVAPAQAEALRALLEDGRKRNDFMMTARLAAPMLSSLPPTNDLDWFGADAARALFAAGKLQEARAWMRIADAEGAASLWIIGRLVEGGVPQPTQLHDALAAEPSGDAATALRRSQAAVALLSAFDEPVQRSDITPLVAAPPSPTQALPNVAVWLAQSHAAAQKRVGETVLFSLVIARTGDRLTPDLIPLLQAIAGLRAVGLEQDARALAVEAAVAAGI